MKWIPKANSGSGKIGTMKIKWSHGQVWSLTQSQKMEVPVKGTLNDAWETDPLLSSKIERKLLILTTWMFLNNQQQKSNQRLV